jgi:glyoxylase-like metal-dependent hydrolase (beta-lactamase superfamily II)
MALKIMQIKSDLSDNFSYLVYCPTTPVGIVVDPSTAAKKILEKIRELELDIFYVVNTHGHGDHTQGNRAILEETGAQLAAHPLEVPTADLALEDGSTLPPENGTIQILHTPGHSPGSICLHIPPDGIITGDTLFVTKVGRADFPGSNPEALFNSLQRLAALPPETKIYPGHDYGPQPISTIEFEKENNPFLKCKTLEEFIRLRMG